MRIARNMPPLRLGVRVIILDLIQTILLFEQVDNIKFISQPSVRIPSDAEMVVISQYLVKMQEADSPLDKMENLLSAISVIFNSVINRFFYCKLFF